jgi:hypothetical protein
MQRVPSSQDVLKWSIFTQNQNQYFHFHVQRTGLSFPMSLDLKRVLKSKLPTQNVDSRTAVSDLEMI